MLTDGVRVIVNVLADVAAEHVPLPLAVNVNVTLPAVISAALGVYIAAVNEFALVNEPVPEDVHNMLD